MRTYLSHIALFFIFLLFTAYPIPGKGNEGLTHEHFLAQYFPAFQEGNIQRLEQLVQEHREIAQQASDYLNDMGIQAYHNAEYQTALTVFKVALDIDQRLGNRVGEGHRLNNLGTIYDGLGDYQEALTYYQQALVIRKEVGDRNGEGITLNNIGRIYDHFGEYELALDHYQQSLNIRKEIGDRNGEGTTLNNLGATYESLGNYRQALSYYQQALGIRKSLDNRAGEGITLNNIGGVYESVGDYQLALGYYQDALDIFRDIGAPIRESTILNNLGLLYYNVGEYQKATEHFQEALRTKTAIGDQVGKSSILNNLGATYERTGEHQRALRYYEEALEISRRIGERADEGITLNNIGGVYESIGEYQYARNYYQDALALFRKSKVQAHEGIALNNIGVLYSKIGECQQALHYLRQSLKILHEVEDSVGKSLSLREIGYCYEKQGKLTEALHHYKQAIHLLEDIRDRVGQQETKANFMEGHIDVYAHTIKLLLQLELSEEAFEYAERSKAQSFLEQLYEVSLRIGPNIERPLVETVEQVQQHILHEGEVLVEYMWGGEEFYIFVIGKTKLYTYTLTIDSQMLINTIGKAMNHTIAYELYQILFQPLEQKIAEALEGEKIKSLIIVPDSMLCYLPFEMLVTKDGEIPEYLVDRYPITYAPSASVLKPEILQTRQPEHYTQDLLALAPFGQAETTTAQVAMKATEDLLLSDTLRSGLEGIQPLPYSAGEVQTISRLYPQSVCKIGADATKAYFKDHAKGNRYLHLSTHGYLDPEHAMYSGLLFSDGMLQTYEIFNLDIDAELTVLSACQTGLGELKAGEGLVGLTRAFMYAGSPSVLVSLWPVSDPSTAVFMKRFYRNLNRGMTKAAALRETKLWMKEKSYHTDEHGNVIKHDNPFYWAPFILVGAYE